MTVNQQPFNPSKKRGGEGWRPKGSTEARQQHLPFPQHCSSTPRLFLPARPARTEPCRGFLSATQLFGCRFPREQGREVKAEVSPLGVEMLPALSRAPPRAAEIHPCLPVDPASTGGEKAGCTSSQARPQPELPARRSPGEQQAAGPTQHEAAAPQRARAAGTACFGDASSGRAAPHGFILAAVT